MALARVPFGWRVLIETARRTGGPSKGASFKGAALQVSSSGMADWFACPPARTKHATCPCFSMIARGARQNGILWAWALRTVLWPLAHRQRRIECKTGRDWADNAYRWARLREEGNKSRMFWPDRRLTDALG